jgi:hypothetical protein
MRLGERSAVPLLLPLVLCVVLLVSLAGCGGSQSGGGGQEKAQGGKPAGEAAKKEPLPRKMTFGIVRAFKDDKRRLSLLPTVNAQGKKPVGFKVRKNAKITLEGEKAGPDAIEEGMQAQVSYVIKKEVNRAVGLQLFEPDEPSREDEKKEQPSGGSEKKEQPSGEGEKSG